MNHLSSRNLKTSGVKKGTMNEAEAMLRFIEFRTSLTKKGSGSSGSGIANFNNFLEFQRTVKSVSDGNIGVLSPW